MSLRKSRFVHYQTNNPFSPYRGFTVWLSPHDADKGPLIAEAYVDVSVALCSKDDHFCRAYGRGTAIAAKVQTMEVTKLPLFLAELKAKCLGYTVIDLPNERYYANEWAWVWKYFL